MVEMRMDGRCALIAGGSKGIGLAAATNFMRAGADVAIIARRPGLPDVTHQWFIDACDLDLGNADTATAAAEAVLTVPTAKT